MEFIKTFINLAIFIILFHIILLISSFYFAFIATPIYNNDGTLMTKESKNASKGFFDQIGALTLPILILILIFFSVMYIIYLIIINVIPETGIRTIFIPIRELLLSIEPIPTLMQRGVFKLYDKILELLGIKEIFIKIVIKFGSILIDFSKDNIKDALIFAFPNFENQINEYVKKTENNSLLNNDNNDNNDKSKIQDLNKNEIYKQIAQDKDECIAKNTIMIRPDMSASEKMQITMQNNFEKVNCESRSIGNYIRSNN